MLLDRDSEIYLIDLPVNMKPIQLIDWQIDIGIAEHAKIVQTEKNTRHYWLTVNMSKVLCYWCLQTIFHSLYQYISSTNRVIKLFDCEVLSIRFVFPPINTRKQTYTGLTCNYCNNWQNLVNNINVNSVSIYIFLTWWAKENFVWIKFSLFGAVILENIRNAWTHKICDVLIFCIAHLNTCSLQCFFSYLLKKNGTTFSIDIFKLCEKKTAVVPSTSVWFVIKHANTSDKFLMNVFFWTEKKLVLQSM